MKTTSFGAFISLTPGKDGLLHISQIRRLVGGKRINQVEDVLNVGDQVQVEIEEIDERGKLSLVAVLSEEQEAELAENEAKQESRRSEDEDRPRRSRNRSRRHRNNRRDNRRDEQADGDDE